MLRGAEAAGQEAKKGGRGECSKDTMLFASKSTYMMTCSNAVLVNCLFHLLVDSSCLNLIYVIVIF